MKIDITIHSGKLSSILILKSLDSIELWRNLWNSGFKSSINLRFTNLMKLKLQFFEKHLPKLNPLMVAQDLLENHFVFYKNMYKIWLSFAKTLCGNTNKPKYWRVLFENRFTNKLKSNEKGLEKLVDLDLNSHFKIHWSFSKKICKIDDSEEWFWFCFSFR